jgi:hypothetical protein
MENFGQGDKMGGGGALGDSYSPHPPVIFRPLQVLFWLGEKKTGAEQVDLQFELLLSLLLLRRHDTQPNDTQHNDTQHNDTQQNDIQHNEAKHNDTQHYDTQHNDTQPNNTQFNDT